MKITSSSIETVDIRLTRSITTARGSLGDRSGIRVRLETSDLVGFGESAPIPGASDSGSLEAMAAELDAWTAAATGATVDDLLAGLDSSPLGPLARFAAHTALADLASQGVEAPPHQWLRAGSPSTVRTSTLVAAESPKDVHGLVADQISRGVTAIKLKVGAAPPDDDIARLASVRNAVGDDIDPNRAPF